jgi:hypothetical protein
MFMGDDVSWLRLEFAADLAAPSAIFEGLPRPSCLLNWRNVLPILLVSRTVATMQRIENAKLRIPRCIQDLQHMRNAMIYFCNSLQAIP